MDGYIWYIDTYYEWMYMMDEWMDTIDGWMGTLDVWVDIYIWMNECMSRYSEWIQWMDTMDVYGRIRWIAMMDRYIDI